MKLYVAPMQREAFSAALRDVPGEVRIREPADGWIGLDDLIPRAPVAHLLEYLRSSGQIVALNHERLAVST